MSRLFNVLHEILSGPDKRLSARSTLAYLSGVPAVFIAVYQALTCGVIDVAGVSAMFAFSAACLGLTTYTTANYHKLQADVAKTETSGA